MKQQYNEKAKQRCLVSEHFVFCSSFYDFSIVVIFFLFSCAFILFWCTCYWKVNLEIEVEIIQ